MLGRKHAVSHCHTVPKHWKFIERCIKGFLLQSIKYVTNDNHDMLYLYLLTTTFVDTLSVGSCPVSIF